MAVVLESMQLEKKKNVSVKETMSDRAGNIHSTVDLGQVTVGDQLRRLEADTELETGRAPVNELDGALGLECCDGAMGILGDDISSVQQASGHVLAVAGITLHHLVVGLEAGHRDLLDRVGLMGSLGSRDDGRISDEGEVDAGIRHQVRLEFVQVDVQGPVKPERGSDRGHN